MKKIMVFLILSVFLSMTNKVDASIVIEQNLSTLNDEVIYFDDGSYIVYSIKEFNSYAPRSNEIIKDSYTKTSQKRVTKYGSDGSELWVYVLNATFFIETGISSECLSSSYSTTINDSSWKFSDGNSSFENNVAYGKGVFKNKVLFITTQTVNIDIALTCDVNGNLS